MKKRPKQRCSARLGTEVALHAPEVDEGLKTSDRRQAVLKEFGVDEVERALGEGMSLSEIARKLEVPYTTFWKWLNSDEDRSARVRSARQMSATAHAQRALDALLNAPSNATEISRAREVAAHYRWAAKSLAPELYGDKLQITERPASVIDGLRQLEERRRATDPDANL